MLRSPKISRTTESPTLPPPDAHQHLLFFSLVQICVIKDDVLDNVQITPPVRNPVSRFARLDETAGVAERGIRRMLEYPVQIQGSSMCRFEETVHSTESVTPHSMEVIRPYTREHRFADRTLAALRVHLHSAS